MNYVSDIEIGDKDKWKKFGSKLAPIKYWEETVDFIKDLDPKKQGSLGLWKLTMNLPRPDDLEGVIRPRIAVIPTSKQTLSFGINDHVEIDQSSAMTMVKILDANWEKSLEFSKNLISKIMNSQLRDTK